MGKDTTSGSNIENNTVYKNNGYGLFAGDDAKNTKVTNNIVYLNQGGNIGVQNPSETVISHNLTSDPLFVNAATNDFHLRPESSAIDKGELLNSISKDFTDTPRPQGSGYDIGAYEEIPEADNTPPAVPQSLVAY